MTKLEAGRELDKIVAEQVMGLTDLRWREGTLFGAKHRFLECGPAVTGDYSESVPYYSTWMHEAWDVVESLLPHFDFDLDCFIREEERIYVASFDDICNGNGNTAAEAICLAALKAVGYEHQE